MKQLLDKMEELKAIPGLYEFTMANCFCAGGAVRDLLRDKKPKDYDIFFKTEKAIEIFKASFLQFCEDSPMGNYNLNDFQFITISFGKPEEVIAKFDWNVNQCYVDFGPENTGNWIRSYWTTDILTFNTNASYPLSAALRLPAMLEKGYRITPAEHAFMMAFIANRGCLESSERAEKELALAPSGNSKLNLKGVPERAIKAALMHSPLAKAMSEDDEDCESLL